MRLVLDTNVVVAGIVAEGLCREIVEVRLLDHSHILSEVLWAELVETLERKFDLVQDELPILTLYRRSASWVEPVELDQPVCRDPDDDRVLAAALAGEAEAIVTGDRDLLELGEFRGIPVLSPRGFLERLAKS